MRKYTPRMLSRNHVIFKFPIKLEERSEIQMHKHAAILHAGLDPTGTPCIWAMVDTTEKLTPTTIFVIGTGNQIPYDQMDHVASFVDRCFVWHVFIPCQAS